jgi:hypothetical protein
MQRGKKNGWRDRAMEEEKREVGLEGGREGWVNRITPGIQRKHSKFFF